MKWYALTVRRARRHRDAFGIAIQQRNANAIASAITTTRRLEDIKNAKLYEVKPYNIKMVQSKNVDKFVKMMISVTKIIVILMCVHTSICWMS